jgi:hypothetical protein
MGGNANRAKFVRTCARMTRHEEGQGRVAQLNVAKGIRIYEYIHDRETYKQDTYRRCF